MNRTTENIVSSFFFYMWNAWNEEECRKVFIEEDHRHFWAKWCAAATPSVHGAAEKFYAELTQDNRVLLVNRACELYDGNQRATPPDDEHILVCEECGSTNVQVQAWVSPNEGNQFIDDAGDTQDSGNNWCEECEDHVSLITLKQFNEEK